MAGEFMLGLGEGHTQEVPANLVQQNEKRFRVIIEQGDENELNYVAIGVNGNVFQIMRGVEVELPESYLNVLNDATGTRLVKEYIEADRKHISVPRTFNRYPYRVLGEVKVEAPKQATKVGSTGGA